MVPIRRWHKRKWEPLKDVTRTVVVPRVIGRRPAYTALIASGYSDADARKEITGSTSGSVWANGHHVVVRVETSMMTAVGTVKTYELKVVTQDAEGLYDHRHFGRIVLELCGTGFVGMALHGAETSGDAGVVKMLVVPQQGEQRV